MSNPDATKDVPAVETRKKTQKGLTYSQEILFNRQKMLLLRLQRKSENIKNLIENSSVYCSEPVDKFHTQKKIFYPVIPSDQKTKSSKIGIQGNNPHIFL